METWTALLVFPVFAWVAFAGRFTVSRFGAGIIAAACLFIPLWLRRSRRPAPDPGLPLLEALVLERARVVEQVKLLQNVLWWYLLPLGLGVVLFLAGPWSAPWQIGAAVLAVLALYGWIYRLNQKIVRTELQPELGRLDEALSALQRDA